MDLSLFTVAIHVDLEVHLPRVYLKNIYLEQFP